MRIDGKFKASAVCVIIIFCFCLTSLVWGEIDIKNAIIGKWERYDPKYKGKETMEFFKDNTISLFHESFGFPVAGDYKFIDNNNVKINLGGLWSLVGPIICKISLSGNNLTLAFPDGDVAEYQRVSTKVIQPSKETTGDSQKNEKKTKPQIAGNIAEFNNINTLLHGVGAAVLKCPKESCDNYEEEAAKVLISHLLTKKSGKWLSGFVALEIAKKLILSGLDEYIQMAIPLGEVGIKKIVTEIKNKFEKSNGADVKVVGLGWKDIGVLPIYLPYRNRDGRYGNVDGEALMVFYSPHSISIKEIKEQVKSGGGRLILYIPPVGLDEKLRQLPNEGVVRPFKLIIRGTVYELGEVKTYESWGETIKGPVVTFLGDKESIGPKVQITSSLRILEPPPYNLGQTITAEFSIKNTGTAPISFDILTVGGRVNGICPQDICPDFTWEENITLQSNGIYPYKGKLRLEASGNYHFFTAYRTKEGWNTAIPTAIEVTNTKDIAVEDSPSAGGVFGTYIGTYTNPSAHPGKGEASVVKSKLDLWKDNTCLMGILGKWKIKVRDEPAPHVKVIIAPEWQKFKDELIAMRPNFIGYIDGDIVEDVGTNEKFIKQPDARPLTGYIKGGIVRYGFEGGVLKQVGGKLWSTYIGEKKVMFLEFKEDETAFFGGFGKWDIKGDTLILYFKTPDGKELSRIGKIKGNTITLEEMVFVKYR